MFYFRDLTRLFFRLNIAVLILASGSTEINAAPTVPPLDVTEALSTVAIGEYLEVLVDGSRTLKVDDVISTQNSDFEHVGGAHQIFGYGWSAVWGRFRIVNRSSETTTLVLENRFNFNSVNEVYQEISGDLKRLDMGGANNKNFSLSSLKSRFPSTNIKLPPGESVFYTRMVSESQVNVALFLYNPAEFFYKESFEALFLAMLGGMILIMGVYNLGLFMLNREKSFLYFGVLCLLSCGWFVWMEGLLKKIYLPFSVLDGQIWLEQVIYLAVAVELGLFLPAFLNLKKSLPKADVALKSAALFCILVMAYAFFDRAAAAELYVNFISIFTFVPFAVAIWGSIKGDRTFIYYLIASITYLVGTFIFLFATLGILEASFFMTSAIYIGMALRVGLLSFAVGDNMRRKEVEAQRTITHSYEQLAKVVYPHQLITIKAGGHLEDSMLVGQGEGAAIVFDIAASSQIEHENTKSFFQNVMLACAAEMTKNYDATKLSSDAYRVKEMGDGFICSVGFPFAVPGTDSKSEFAFRLALRFYERFSEAVKDFKYHKPIYCGIGIAYGGLQSYFPNSGAKQYDIFGKTLVRANRYESFRKKLLPLLGINGSVLIIQETVYWSMNENSRQCFKEFSLENKKYKMRNDAAATKVYYMMLEAAAHDEKKQVS